MREVIRRNQRRSWFLIGLMGAILVTLGFVIGFAFNAEVGGALGALAAVALWLILFLVSIFQGDSLLLASSKARQIQKADAPRLWNVVEEMTIASGLRKMPRVFIIDDDVPNAFAVGRKTETAAVAITSGLLKRLTRDELQGVIAHEIGHIKNLDIRFMTIASVMVGSITLLADFFFRSLIYGSGRRSSSSRGGGQAQIVFLIIAIVVAILAPICAQMLYFACSRRREYLADASAARFTRYPEGLASALEKITVLATGAGKPNRALAPLYIVSPLRSARASSLFSTHPPSEQRIKILRSMGGGAGYVDYEAAYKRIAGGACVDAATLGADTKVTAREGSAAKESREDTLARIREVNNLLGRAAELIPIICACGVNIKVPAELDRPTVPCPRCGSEHEVPHAGPAAASGKKDDTRPATAGDEERDAATERMSYTRRLDVEWDSFKCECGRVLQLSPSFIATSITCRGCKRVIDIVTPEKSATGA